MKVLGIDPGSIYCGYGLIRILDSNLKSEIKNQQYKYLSSGRIVMPAAKPLCIRLRELFTSLMDVIGEYEPDEVATEKIFFAKGIKAALTMGHTRGVVLLAATMRDIPIYEYSALEVKKAVVGYGRADKNQVQKMVGEILKINHTLSSDSADALALALCHANIKKMKLKAEKGS
ncbi:MAG: crossover junction endodeoxyribonuclease RuvC [Thermodesulfovibrio sp.]|nr:crossover junction endodeoxyribonuclease RuvC [Thermodesulfovibrio sp.]